MTALAGFEPDGFWLPESDEPDEYLEPPPTPALVAQVQAELGVRLPAAYLELVEQRNGGYLARTCAPAAEPTSWAPDHVGVTGIFGLGRTKDLSVGGLSGPDFWVREWGYPPIGVYIADCPSAGHDLIALDYRVCGPDGEPSVVHVDQEFDYRIVELAPDFRTFLLHLTNEDAFDLD